LAAVQTKKTTELLLAVLLLAFLASALSLLSALRLVATGLLALISACVLMTPISPCGLVAPISARGLVTLISACGLLTLVSARGLVTLVSARGFMTLISARGLVTLVSARGSVTLIPACGLVTLVSARGFMTLISACGLVTLISACGLVTLISACGFMTLISACGFMALVSACGFMALIPTLGLKTATGIQSRLRRVPVIDRVTLISVMKGRLLMLALFVCCLQMPLVHRCLFLSSRFSIDSAGAVEADAVIRISDHCAVNEGVVHDRRIHSPNRGVVAEDVARPDTTYKA
jgi:hypothetical protein